MRTAALANAQVEEMKLDQALPQMPAPHSPHAAKDDRADDEGPYCKGKRIPRAPGYGQ